MTMERKRKGQENGRVIVGEKEGKEGSKQGSRHLLFESPAAQGLARHPSFEPLLNHGLKGNSHCFAPSFPFHNTPLHFVSLSPFVPLPHAHAQRSAFALAAQRASQPAFHPHTAIRHTQSIPRPFSTPHNACFSHCRYRSCGRNCRSRSTFATPPRGRCRSSCHRGRPG